METLAMWFLPITVIYLHRCHFQLGQTKITIIDKTISYTVEKITSHVTLVNTKNLFLRQIKQPYFRRYRYNF